MDFASHRDLLRTFARGWKSLLGIHLAFSLVAGTLAAPLAAVTLQGAVLVSGEPALSDTEITAFIFSPAGAVAALAIGTLVLTLQLLGYATLLIPARSLLKGGSAEIDRVLPLLLPALPRLLRISLRFIVRLVLWSLPAASLLGAIYLGMLGDHDINFYLAENPPVFRWALVLAALVLLGHLILVARIATGWVHALPLAIFRGESPDTALRLSREAATGRRKSIFIGLVVWGLLTPFVAWLLNLPWSAIAMWAAGHLQDQLGWLIVVLGLCFALASGIAWLTAACGLSLISLQNTRLYLDSGLDDSSRPTRPGHRLPFGWRSAIAGGLAGCGLTIFLSHLWIESIHDEEPAVVIAHRGASAVAPENTLATVREAIEAGADWVEIDFLGLNARTTSRKLVRQAHKRGVEVHVWTVNDPVDMSTQLGRGINGLITDHPALARKVIAEREEASFGEKLLLDLAAVLGRKPPTPPQ